MKYYGYLKQEGEGCDYTIGCGEHLISLKSTNGDDALIELRNEIEENYSEERSLQKVILFSSAIEVDVKSIYREMRQRESDANQKRQHIKDMEEFERLKKKLGK